MWDKAVAYSISSAPFTIMATDPNELTLSWHYNIEFSTMLPEGYDIQQRVTVADVTSTGCHLVEISAQYKRHTHVDRAADGEWHSGLCGSLRYL